jgi:hypothetical protein
MTATGFQFPALVAFRARLKSMILLGGLKAVQPGKAAMERLSAASMETLAFSAQNPELSEAGRAAAFAALADKIGPEQAHREVESFIDTLHPPGFVRADDVATNDAVFFGFGRWLLQTFGALALASAIVLTVGVFWANIERQRGLDEALKLGIITQAELDEANRTAPLAPEGQPQPPTTTDKLNALALRPQVRALIPLFPYIDAAWTQALNWSVFLFPAYSVLLALRQKPARVLLLRRFNDRKIGASVSKFSKRWLTPYGHVYSLADKVMKRNWLGVMFSWFSFNPFLLLWRLLNVPIALLRRLFNRAVAGPIMIWTTRDFRNFAKRMTDLWGPNLEMHRTQRRAILVRTSDDWWKQVVLMLMHGADVIVVDVTEVAAGTAWELETMLAENVAERIVFVARDDKLEEAAASLRGHGFADRADNIIGYRKNGGLKNAKAFREAMRGAMHRRLTQAPAPNLWDGAKPPRLLAPASSA